VQCPSVTEVTESACEKEPLLRSRGSGSLAPWLPWRWASGFKAHFSTCPSGPRLSAISRSLRSSRSFETYLHLAWMTPAVTHLAPSPPHPATWIGFPTHPFACAELNRLFVFSRPSLSFCSTTPPLSSVCRPDVPPHLARSLYILTSCTVLAALADTHIQTSPDGYFRTVFPRNFRFVLVRQNHYPAESIRTQRRALLGLIASKCHH
jgi:hypothetical protein